MFFPVRGTAHAEVSSSTGTMFARTSCDTCSSQSPTRPSGKQRSGFATWIVQPSNRSDEDHASAALEVVNPVSPAFFGVFGPACDSYQAEEMPSARRAVNTGGKSAIFMISKGVTRGSGEPDMMSHDSVLIFALKMRITITPAE